MKALTFGQRKQLFKKWLQSVPSLRRSLKILKPGSSVTIITPISVYYGLPGVVQERVHSGGYLIRFSAKSLASAMEPERCAAYKRPVYFHREELKLKESK